MRVALEYIQDTFDIHVLILFIISSMILLLIDCKEYKKKDLKKEYKFSKFFGIFYIVFGLVMFILATAIKI